MLKRVYRGLVGVALVAAIGLAQAPQKKVKDQMEFDLYSSIQKETDPAKKLALLDQWTEKYADTEFKQERNLFYIQTYSGMAMQAQQPKATDEQMAAADKAAHMLMDKGDTFFSPDMKMASTTDDQWKQAKTAVMLQANQAIAANAVAKKDWAGAEAQYKKMLTDNPNDAATSYMLGTAIASQKQVARTPEALYEFARASVLTGPGALAPEGQKQTDAYLKRAYVGYHGAADGLEELKTAAKNSALPPAGFTIESVTVVQQKQFSSQAAFDTAHPEIALWRSLRTELTGPNGQDYFNKSMKDTSVPNLKGKVVAQPSPKELTVAVDNVTPETTDKAEATLMLDSPLKGTVEPGTEITFVGAPTAFAKDPFMITFDVEKKSVTGLGAAAGPAGPVTPRRPPVRKKK